MKAFIFAEGGATIAEIADPVMKPGHVRVRIKAACLNRADLGMIAGHMHGARGGPGTVLGIEWAGEVIDAGDTDFKVGDRLMGSGGGGFAEEVVAFAGRVLPVPPSMSWEEAATLPVGLTTMHNALVTAGRFQRGQTVMVQGASSGVGLMCTKIAKKLGASLVVGSSTNAERRSQLKDFGCDLAVDSNDPDWVRQVLDATGGEGVDVIVDNVSGKTVNASLAATKIKGHIVNVGRLGGVNADFNFDLHALRRINYIGVTFRTRSPEEIRDIFEATRRDLWDAVVAGELSLPIDRTYPFAQIKDAAAHMAANGHFGKIVVTM